MIHLKQFCVIVTREGRLRFKFLRKEHGLLHDAAEKKTYAIVKDPYPTNWAGRWSRAYLIHEDAAQSVQVGSPDGDEGATDGSTVEIVEPLNMLAKIRVPGPRGEDAGIRETYLTAESIYDRTLSVQVRRLGNRRIQWFHALLFVSLGVAICLALVAAIAIFSSGGDAPDASPSSGIQVEPNAPLAAPTSGPIEQAEIVVHPTPRPASPDG